MKRVFLLLFAAFVVIAAVLLLLPGPVPDRHPDGQQEILEPTRPQAGSGGRGDHSADVDQPKKTYAASDSDTLTGVLSEARRQLLEDGDLQTAYARLGAVVPQASSNAIIELVQTETFSEQDAPLLHLLARRFAEDANSQSIGLLADAYFATDSRAVRGQLCLLVREIGHEEGLAALGALIGSPRALGTEALDPLMRSSAFALAAAPDPRWLDTLFSAAARGPGGLRTSLLDGLGAVKSSEALPSLFAIIDGNSPLSSNPEFREIAVGLLGQVESERARDKLEELKSGSEQNVAEWAREAAANLKRSAPGLYSAIGQ